METTTALINTDTTTAIYKVVHRLDTQGLTCPEPVMLLHRKIRQMQVGEVVELLATDPSTERDILKFCTFLGHALLTKRQDDKTYLYHIQKRD